MKSLFGLLLAKSLRKKDNFMGKLTLKEKIVGFIGHIGWKMFCWSYPGGENQYLLDMAREVRAFDKDMMGSIPIKRQHYPN